MTADPSVQTYPIESPQYRPRMLYFGVTPGAAQEEIVTLPATAGATQGDFIVIHNQAGVSEALWLDIDGDGTAPTAQEYLDADIKTVVAIATGDDDQDNATAFAGAVTIADVTVTDNSDGTVTLTQDIYGACEDATPYDEDGSGAGSITVSVDTDGVDVSMDNGKFDAVASQTSEGVVTITFDQAFLRSPEVGVTSKTDNLVGRVTDSSVGSVTIEMQDITSGDPTDGSFSLIVLGSDSKDAILQG